jgi:hypothetical protein
MFAVEQRQVQRGAFRALRRLGALGSERTVHVLDGHEPIPCEPTGEPRRSNLEG